ncbi:MAG: hypothetical protein KTR31_20895 [Myxococcales bacterium]|nr:hypothetical protein [Myxococcales bacterium]
MIITTWLSTAAFAGAWTKPQGAAYVKAGADIYQALTFQAPGASERSDGSYFGQQYSIYGEVGVTKGHPLQISLGVPLAVGTHTTEIIDAFGELPVRATTTRAGDMRVTAQTALSRKLPIALALEAKIPLYANGSVGEALPNYAEFFPKPGDGQVDGTLWLFAGAAPSEKIFAEAGLGYIARTELFVGWDTDIEFRDGLRGLGKVGFLPTKKVVLIGSLEGQMAFSNKNAAGEVDTFTRQFLVGGVNALIDIADGIALEPRFALELASRNASRGYGAGIGLSWRRWP